MPAPAPYRIHRYPTQLIETWLLPDGRRATLRPVLPQDDAAVQAFIAALSPAARRNRFHAALNHLSAAQAVHMTQIDYHRQMGFVITVRAGDVDSDTSLGLEPDEEIVIGDARYVVTDNDPQAAEFAIVIADEWAGHGLGRRLIAALCDAARRAGLRWIAGEVLADNAAMLGLAERCGFSRHPHADDDSLVLVERAVETRFGAPRQPGFVDSLFGAIGHTLPEWMRRGRGGVEGARF